MLGVDPPPAPQDAPLANPKPPLVWNLDNWQLYDHLRALGKALGVGPRKIRPGPLTERQHEVRRLLVGKWKVVTECMPTLLGWHVNKELQLTQWVAFDGSGTMERESLIGGAFGFWSLVADDWVRESKTLMLEGGGTSRSEYRVKVSKHRLVLDRMEAGRIAIRLVCARVGRPQRSESALKITVREADLADVQKARMGEGTAHSDGPSGGAPHIRLSQIVPGDEMQDADDPRALEPAPLESLRPLWGRRLAESLHRILDGQPRDIDGRLGEDLLEPHPAAWAVRRVRLARRSRDVVVRRAAARALAEITATPARYGLKDEHKGVAPARLNAWNDLRPLLDDEDPEVAWNALEAWFRHEVALDSETADRIARRHPVLRFVTAQMRDMGPITDEPAQVLRIPLIGHEAEHADLLGWVTNEASLAAVPAPILRHIRQGEVHATLWGDAVWVTVNEGLRRFNTDGHETHVIDLPERLQPVAVLDDARSLWITPDARRLLAANWTEGALSWRELKPSDATPLHRPTLRFGTWVQTGPNRFVATHLRPEGASPMSASDSPLGGWRGLTVDLDAETVGPVTSCRDGVVVHAGVTVSRPAPNASPLRIAPLDDGRIALSCRRDWLKTPDVHMGPLMGSATFTPTPLEPHKNRWYRLTELVAFRATPKAALAYHLAAAGFITVLVWRT